MSSHATEDEQVECLQIDEAGQELAAQLHTFDEMEEVVHVQEVDDDDDEEEAEVAEEALHLDELSFNNCSEDLTEEVLTMEQEEEEEAEVVEIHTEEKPKAVAIPPLRPLTIAPKPAKLPVSFKPVAGQQLLLVQGAGAGQQIKLLSTAQGLNLTNLSIAKPINIKQTPKANLSLVAPKKVVMKKIVQKSLTKAFDGKPTQQIMVLQKSDAPVKLLPATTTKQLTLSEVQQMGLIGSTAKIIPHAAKQIVMNKVVGQPKAIKIIPQVRPPTKILPAPQIAAASTSTKPQPQRIYLKQASVTNATAAGATHILPGQIIQVPSGQAGQLHQIIPGKTMQYIKFVTTTQSVDTPLITSPTPVAATKIAAAKAPPTAVTTPTKQIIKVGKALPAGATVSRTLTLTTPKSSQQPPPLATPATSTPRASAAATARHAAGDAVVPKIASPDLTMESNGIKTRKPCNCAKSQCLKLYCDCFANGEFCFMCNCMNCFNNIENEEQRQRAIKNCLERNPNAFRPKIGKGKETGEAAIRKHTKGCNCKRSGCLKNYCECYEAKIACSSNCKCMGCMNVESPPLAIAGNLNETRNTGRSEGSSGGGSGYMSSPPSAKKTPVDANTKRKSVAKQPSSYINGAVIEATSQCLLSMAKNAEDMGQSEEITKREIIEEFGRCLKQIIECTVNKG